MIWQPVIMAALVAGVIGVYGKHTDGDVGEAAQLATGMAALAGIVLIVTGFAINWPSKEEPKPVTVVAKAPTLSPTETVLPPRAAPVQPQPLPVGVTSAMNPGSAQNLPPQVPATSTPQIDLGAPGAAFDRVEAIMMRYKQIYQQGVNEIQQTDTRYARGQELCRNQASQYATVARLGSVSTNKTGDASITFNTPSGMELIPAGTFGRGNPIHDALATVAPGTSMVVTFTFQADDTGKDCFHSHRWTERNNMTQPQWDIDLVSIAPLR